ncbi:PDDEXK nuclease domain-containing protein [Treponema zioleckii]|uniref:PDDEXK nuclease domain-containing protein n=1 Tax=Treponema zioleckii TaxID=331680 RepID=UPI00168C040E|nr:PDDEXK nuclease domain-containing protein [Treponema zioleckii]
MEKELINIESVNFTDDYIKDIKVILHSAKSQSYKAVNSVMIQAYWLVGFRIVEQEQKGEKRAGYGEKVIENLSKALNAELGSGMSVAHLWNCRQFYLTFRDSEILSTLCRELSWSHIRMIMRLDSEAERNYYINEAKQGSWSVRELERNIKTDMFHRVLQNQIKPFASKTPAKAVETHIKDPYILEFLGIKPEISTSEKDIENAIISHMEKFLLEMGKGFSFVERQMHIKTETQDFYIDLVFYNYILKCFVLVDLKKGSLKHQDIGQMDMYVRMFDSLKKCDDDNPTIGIIFCADKDESIVKYSVLNESEQIFASKYKTVLPTEEELKLELDRNRRFLQDRKGGK